LIAMHGRTLGRRRLRARLAQGLAIMLAAAAPGAWCAEPATGGASMSDAEIAALHASLLTVDAHLDIPFDFATEKNDPAVDGKLQVDLPKMERGGVDAAVFAIWVQQEARTPENYARADELGRQKLAAIRRMTEWYPSRIGLALTADDVERIVKSGRRAAVIGMLNGFPLGRDAGKLDFYYAHGLRQFGFTHAGNNDLADSSRPAPRNGDRPGENGGLSPVGRKLLGRLNDLGIIVDVSQLTPDGVQQACTLTRAPIVASHSGVRAIVDNPRNLTDPEMQCIARTGGVVHIVAFGNYVRSPPPEFKATVAALRQKYGAADEAAMATLPPERQAAYTREYLGLLAGLPKANVADYVNSIDYAVKLVGVDHVGLSSDFEHGGGVDGWRNEGEAPNVTRELLRRGYSRDDIAKLWGLNWLRVFREVEAKRRH
jgi:membrane dipeptidase